MIFSVVSAANGLLFYMNDISFMRMKIHLFIKKNILSTLLSYRLQMSYI